MDHYEKAIQDFKSGRLKSALAHYKRAITEENLSPEKKVNGYRQSLVIYESQGKGPDYIHWGLQFANYLMEISLHREAASVLEVLRGESEELSRLGVRGEVYRKLISTMESVGKVEEVHRYSLECLDYFFQRKNITQGLALSTELAAKYKKNFEFKVFVLKFAILQNNHQRIGEAMVAILEEFKYQEKTPRREGRSFLEVFNDVKEVLKDNYSDEKNLVIVKEWLVWGAFAEWEDGAAVSSPEFLQVLITKTLNLILESLLLAPKDLALYALAAKFYYLNHMKKKALKIIEFIQGRRTDAGYSGYERIGPSVMALKKKVLAQKEELEEFVGFKGTASGGSVQTMDLAADLLGESPVDQEQLSRVGKLEEDIKSLYKEKRFKEMMLSLDELGRLQPESGILKEYQDKWDFLRRKGESGETMYQALLQDISHFCGVKEAPDSEESELAYFKRSFLRYFEKAPCEEFASLSKDLVVAFNTLEFPEVSMIILDRMEKEGGVKGEFRLEEFCHEDKDPREVTDFLDNQYLKIMTYLKMDRMYEGNALAEYINQTMPLKNEERLCFLYLEAEIKRNLKKNGHAYQLFKTIEKMDPDYRMTRERIKEFEKNK